MNYKALWNPSEEYKRQSHLAKFMEKFGLNPTNTDFHKWSIDNLQQFWKNFLEFSEVIYEGDSSVVLEWDKSQPTYTGRFFPNINLNFAENLLKHRGSQVALTFYNETGAKITLTHDELFSSVEKLASYLKQNGMKPGDRVGSVIANTPHALIGMLATSALGGVWCGCSPDFGADGLNDRLSQVEPKFLLAGSGAHYGGSFHEIYDKIASLSDGIKSIEKVIWFEYPGKKTEKDISKWVKFEDILNSSFEKLVFEKFPFDHPLYIMFSSGTTGKPKCIIHRAGGVLIEHLKEHLLHCNIQKGDKVFYYSTCAWMMWHWHMSALASSGSLVIFDGSPFYPEIDVLFKLAESEQVNLFGISASYIEYLKKHDLDVKSKHNTSSIKTITSTGSALSKEGFEYVYSDISPDVALHSISGGTDIVGCFALGHPFKSVYAEELQTASFGLDVQIFDEEGKRLIGEKGELVCLNPFPSMPIGFYNDENKEKYKSTYFEKFPQIWCHGDFVKQTEHDGFIFYGRADATLKPGGVRIGTAEIYQQVLKVPEVLESLAIDQEWKDDRRVILFVVLKESFVLNDELKKKIKKQIKEGASPRHVPSKLIAVKAIPKTKNGKIVELAVRAVVHNEAVKNIHSLANPETLEYFKNLDDLKTD